MLKCSHQYALRRRSAAVCLKPCYRPACFPNLVKRSDLQPLFLDAASNGAFLAGSSFTVMQLTCACLADGLLVEHMYMPRSWRVYTRAPRRFASSGEARATVSPCLHRAQPPEQLRPCLTVNALRSRSSSRRGRLRRRIDEQSTLHARLYLHSFIMTRPWSIQSPLCNALRSLLSLLSHIDH